MYDAKRVISLILTLFLLLTLVACRKDDAVTESSKSTVPTPYEVYFYKDGMQTVSTDKEFNLKIARHIEAEYERSNAHNAATNLAAWTDTIDEVRKNETAVELRFDTAVKFNDEYVISSDACILFIPVTGEYANFMFNNYNSPDYWGGPCHGDFRLEEFFEQVTFTPLTEDEVR